MASGGKRRTCGFGGGTVSGVVMRSFGSDVGSGAEGFGCGDGGPFVSRGGLWTARAAGGG